MLLREKIPSDFKEGQRVTYVPYHANGDAKHKDCEFGIVSSCNDTYVFVKYYTSAGELKTTAQATKPDQLIVQ